MTAGQFDWRTSNVIDISEKDVSTFERASINSSSHRQGMSFFLAITILHEFVHLGDNFNGFYFPGEEGSLFAMQVYGTDINSVDA